MKLIRVFLIGIAVILPVVIYVSLIRETNPDEIHNAKVSSPLYEKPMLHGLAVKDDTKDGDLRENLTALGKEVAHLRADVTALRADMQTQQSKLATSSKNPVQDQVKVVQNLAEMRAEEEEHIQEQGEVLETGFRQQTTDPNWSTKAKSLIQGALASDKVASKDIIDIECRASMCRVELANDGNNKAPKIAEFPMKISEELPNIMVNQTNESDGTSTTILYLSRDDFILPNSGR
jgi:hypothetical protein